MANIKRIDHIGIVVDNLEGALGFWRDALGMNLDHIQAVPAEGASVAFFPTGGSEIELVHPTEAGTGLAKYLEKRGPGVHHICLEVDDIEGMLSELKEKGVQLINEQPRLSADGKKYAFIHPKSGYGVLVELYELPQQTLLDQINAAHAEPPTEEETESLQRMRTYQRRLVERDE